jgi:hypothetical protein
MTSVGYLLHQPQPNPRDVIKDDFRGKLPSGRRPDVRARPCLPRGRRFTRGRVFTVRGRGKNRVRADARVCPRGHERVRADTAQRLRGRWAASARTRKKNNNNFFLKKIKKKKFQNIWLGKREFQFSIFNFRFSIPKIPNFPKLPELRGLRGRSREKKKVFSA